MRLIDTKLIKIFPLITVNSDYFKNKFSKLTDSVIIVVTNGIDPYEFTLVPKEEARKKLGFNLQDKIMLAIGNTFENGRRELLWKTYDEVKRLDPKVILIAGKYLDKDSLPYYLGACDLALLPTNGSKSELVYMGVRVMTYLNAEKVIATDDSPSVWHNLLKDCLIMGKDCEDLAQKIVYFLNSDKSLEDNVRKMKKELLWDNVLKELYDYL
jgi:hypothetical protein